MSERISIVVPDGTRERIKQEAKTQGRTQSNLARKLLLEGLNMCVPVVKASDLKIQIERGRVG